MCYVNASGNGVFTKCYMEEPNPSIPRTYKYNYGSNDITYLKAGVQGVFRINVPVQFQGGWPTVGNYAIIGKYPYLIPTQSSQIQNIVNKINTQSNESTQPNSFISLFTNPFLDLAIIILVLLLVIGLW